MVKASKPAKNDRIRREHSGRLFVGLMRTSPLRDIPIEPAAVRAPVREVRLEEDDPK